MSSLRTSAERIDQAERMLESGSYAQAIALFTEAIALCGQAVSPHPRIAATAHRGRAEAFCKLGRRKESQRDMEAAARLEAAAPYHVWIRDQREHRLSKTISLADIDPGALTRLRHEGECRIVIPESLFDRDHPGHYMRRLVSASLLVSVHDGSIGGLGCGLSFMRGSVRISPSCVGGYPRSGPEDPRFEDSHVTQSATGRAERQSNGLLRFGPIAGISPPFEGQGPADSVWKIRIDSSGEVLETIRDVCLHFNYKAWEGGGELRGQANRGHEAAQG